MTKHYDKRGLPIGYRDGQHFILEDEALQLKEQPKFTHYHDDFDWELFVLNFTGERTCKIPKNPVIRDEIREFLLRRLP